MKIKKNKSEFIQNIRGGINVIFADYYFENIDINNKYDDKNIISYINSLYFMRSITLRRRIKDYYK